MAYYDPVPLSGGDLSKAVRVGGTVRRPSRRWSHQTARLLRHLESTGFDGAPKWLGVDATGRDVLTYIHGQCGFLPQIWNDHTPLAAGRLLRTYHDATRTMDFHADAAWQVIYPDKRRHQVICHNDFAPYNLIFDGREPFAIIDFDMAGPGPALRDVAMGVYWFAPLSFGGAMRERSQADVAAGHRRLRRFCTGYGIEPPPGLMPMVLEWLDFMGNFPEQQVAAGREEYRAMIDQGQVDHWRREAAAFRETGFAL